MVSLVCLWWAKSPGSWKNSNHSDHTLSVKQYFLLLGQLLAKLRSRCNSALVTDTIFSRVLLLFPCLSPLCLSHLHPPLSLKTHQSKLSLFSSHYTICFLFVVFTNVKFYLQSISQLCTGAKLTMNY